MQDTLSFPFLFVLPYLCPQFFDIYKQINNKKKCI